MRPPARPLEDGRPVKRAAFQGVPGAFSHEACLALLPDHAPLPFPTFAAVFAAVERGEADRAVVPVENSTAGPVPEVAALLPASSLRVEAEAWRPIQLALLALPGASLADLRTAHSHPMALKQCARSLAALGLEPVEAFDTAGAAAELAASADRSRAAVASRTAGTIAGLQALRDGLEDTPDNRTRFLVLRQP